LPDDHRYVGALMRYFINPLSLLPSRKLGPNRYDLVVFLLIAATLFGIGYGEREMSRSLTLLDIDNVQLNPWNLPNYALLTTLRMFAAMAASLVFTFVVATLAARSKKAELIIVPALDILQSVPVLGFLTFTVVFFMSLFPGSEFGAELAAIFAIFTSQAWNMAFSFYQSLKTIPHDLVDASAQFQLSAWQRFWKLEAPYATPGLVWNAMMSMSGGWFFVVASEAISVGDTTIKLPGIGSYLALAIDQRDIGAVAAAVLTMGILILLYDQMVFRPIVAWADKFRMDQTASQDAPRSWVLHLVRRAKLLSGIMALFAHLDLARLTRKPARIRIKNNGITPLLSGRWLDMVWGAIVVLACLWAGWLIYGYIRETLTFPDFTEAFLDGCVTLLRVLVLICLASLIWVPIGVYIGLRPRLTQIVQPIAQFLAAFPANVLFPLFVVLIAHHRLNPNIWLSPLMILGTQWYILFNVIAGASAFPNDLREAARLGGIGGRYWWFRVILPGVFPYYITGAITASGGAWNAAIVSEVASWGDTKLQAMGLGTFIANATSNGDYPRVVLGIVVMSIFVIGLNRLVWRRLFAFAESRTRMN